MFILHTLVEQVKVEARHFNRLLRTVMQEVDAKYADRVLPQVGLCVRLFDVLELSPGELFPDDGAAYYFAKVRLIVFAPFAGEIVEGVIIRADLKGLRGSCSTSTSTPSPIYICVLYSLLCSLSLHRFFVLCTLVCFRSAEQRAECCTAQSLKSLGLP
jgi:DNA-directed RNA polymerase subunit E'/Rpb7